MRDGVGIFLQSHHNWVWSLLTILDNFADIFLTSSQNQVQKKLSCNHALATAIRNTYIHIEWKT